MMPDPIKAQIECFDANKSHIMLSYKSSTLIFLSREGKINNPVLFYTLSKIYMCWEWLFVNSWKMVNVHRKKKTKKIYKERKIPWDDSRQVIQIISLLLCFVYLITSLPPLKINFHLIYMLFAKTAWLIIILCVCPLVTTRVYLTNCFQQ